jgi:hypothetical protein
MGYGSTAFNTRFTVRRYAPPGSIRLGRLTAPTPHSTHILPALVLLRKPLFGRAKRRKPFTLCDIGAKIF